ncbi:hypothetical protein J2W46_003552 [Paraburkholderia strydomiana]|nr:hypothetical protein [Paraburkholderia strydomiana]
MKEVVAALYAFDRSQVAKWVGHAATLLQPLVDALRRHVMAATELHADDTPVPVLAPGNGKAKTGRLWVYMRDDRNSGDITPPAVWFAYSPDRKGILPQQHLESFGGTLQADAYGGYQAIYETGRVVEAACWACTPSVLRTACRTTECIQYRSTRTHRRVVSGRGCGPGQTAR